MTRHFHFTTVHMLMLLLNVFVLGGCLVLIAVTGPAGPLLLLTIGTAGMATAKVIKARVDDKKKDSRTPDHQQPA